ncbi:MULTISPECIES: type VII secretion-associated protein [unclassified Mycobacterium]|uniref:type VII secretion-associated protein n=1 Tax=unclassified Mycobacterium TaxID=2642494 RepID=UPI0029C99D41|nr:MULTISPECIES: type VII secretion-associated protein [unclassified Mycobacterium]
MSEAVVVIGPTAVCGPGVADAALVAVALECVDERLAVFDDRVVTVRALWGELVDAVCRSGFDSAVLVAPSWWPPSRVEFVEDVLLEVCAQVVVLRRGTALWSNESAVVEIGPDCVVVHLPDGERSVVSRSERPDFIADGVLAVLPTVASVVLDVPSGVGGAATLADGLARRLRRRNVGVSVVDDEGVRRAVEASGRRSPVRRLRFDPARVAVVTGALVAVTALAGAATGSGGGGVVEGTWVVEGRVAVEVPTSWTVERVTSGPGSARVQAISPEEPRLALHVTQARVPDHETMQATSETLKAALDEQPDGVFADFDAAGQEAGRPAVTYTERRTAVAIDWVVLVDRGIRIAIGCQRPLSGPGGGPACERAVRTAHAVP